MEELMEFQTLRIGVGRGKKRGDIAGGIALKIRNIH